jgi:ABC-2 type transport system permease protein
VRGALAFERVRITTVRSTWILIAAGLLLTLLIALGSVMAGRQDPIDAGKQADLLSGATLLLPVFVGAVGVLAFGHEYRHGTVRPALLAVPVRLQMLAAKAAVVAMTSAAAALGAVAGSWLLALAIRGNDVTSVGLTAGATDRVAVGTVLYTVAWGLLGLALGGLLRSIPGAITLLLVWSLVAEPLILQLLVLDAFEPIRPIGSFLPFVAGERMYAVDADTEAIASFVSNPVSPLAGGLLLAGYVAGLLALCLVLFEHRDA